MLTITFLFDFQPATTDFLKGIWLGSVQKSDKGPFLWNSTGLAFSYSNWSDNQPDNANGVEQCLNMLSADKDGKWNDYGCNYENKAWPTQYTMCERIIN